VTPDYMVEADPDQLAKGIDPQLEKAVLVLQDEVAAWKKNGGNAILNVGPGGLPGPVITPLPMPVQEPAGTGKQK
jgi:hypothetical protein